MSEEIKKYIQSLVERARAFNLEDESEQVCELLGFVKAGECFLDTLPKK
jgi:hypothetical protein